MSNSICNFLPSKNYTGGVKPVHFVYETEFHALRQPFYHAIHSVYLVTGGTAVLKYPSANFSVQTGDVFFAFPSCLYHIDADTAFEYMYISFMGDGCHQLLSDLSIAPAAPVYHGFHHLLPFWDTAIRRKEETNIALLTESVLLYTLSFIKADTATHTVNKPVLERLIDYIDKHYRDPDMSLSRLAAVFSYSEKYISSLFSKHMDLPFKKYLNTLRLQYAYTLIERGETSVSAIAEACGYTDPLYFSRVFKQKRHLTPSEAIKKRDAE